MIARYLTRETAKTGLYLAGAGLAAYKVFPVLRQWDVFTSFPSDAYMERESIMGYEGMDGIVYDVFQNGDAPRTEMSKYSKGKMNLN
jgi:hypothetical protein